MGGGPGKLIRLLAGLIVSALFCIPLAALAHTPWNDFALSALELLETAAKAGQAQVVLDVPEGGVVMPDLFEEDPVFLCWEASLNVQLILQGRGEGIDFDGLFLAGGDVVLRGVRVEATPDEAALIIEDTGEDAPFSLRLTIEEDSAVFAEETPALSAWFSRRLPGGSKLTLINRGSLASVEYHGVYIFGDNNEAPLNCTIENGGVIRSGDGHGLLFMGEIGVALENTGAIGSDAASAIGISRSGEGVLPFYMSGGGEWMGEPQVRLTLYASGAAIADAEAYARAYAGQAGFLPGISVGGTVNDGAFEPFVVE